MHVELYLDIMGNHWNVRNVMRYNQNNDLGCLIWQGYAGRIVRKKNWRTGELVSGVLQKKHWE